MVTAAQSQFMTVEWANGVSIRKAQPEDGFMIWRWRNDLVTRRNFKQTKHVPWCDHVEWFNAKMSDYRSIMLIGEIDEVPAGVVRFDPKEEDGYEICINMAPAYRYRGYGRKILKAACDTMDGAKLWATIRFGNEASMKIFKACGFAWQYSQNQFDVYMHE